MSVSPWREVLTGSYVMAQVVERDDRILKDLLRNVVPIDESHGLVPGRGLHSPTLELNLSNSRTHS